MTDGDADRFALVFRKLVALPLKDRPHAKDQKSVEASYFKLLGKYPFDVVVKAVETLLHTLKRFPTPADWLEMIARDAPRALPPDHRQMTQTEVREHQRARALHFMDEPCSCQACIAAGVNDRQLRFVPDLRDDGETESAIDPTTNEVVMTGHWAHGRELSRWYATRDAATPSIERHPLARRILSFSDRTRAQERAREDLRGDRVRSVCCGADAPVSVRPPDLPGADRELPCTCLEGHAGDHVASATDGRVLARWAR
jgi:hypothetical protein